MQFKDHFSRQSSAYSRYRPGYPARLIEYLAREAPHTNLAVDCATGNGQAAASLAEHFTAVVAIDGSFGQLARAVSRNNLHYVAALAEQLPLPDASAALVTAAQAAHWFDFERFYRECRRVLVPGGVVAVWTYGRLRVDESVDAVVDRFYSDKLGRFWPAERRHVDQAYRHLPFPLRDRPTPDFSMQARWSIDEMIGYLGTWSAVQRFEVITGQDPMAELREELKALWPADRQKGVTWPIHLRLGNT